MLHGDQVVTECEEGVLQIEELVYPDNGFWQCQCVVEATLKMFTKLQITSHWKLSYPLEK